MSAARRRTSSPSGTSLRTHAEAGQFPFIDIGGVFTLYTTSYDPGDLANLSWTQIGKTSATRRSTVTKDIVGNANILTAATCIATGDQPSSVCSSSTIQSIEQD